MSSVSSSEAGDPGKGPSSLSHLSLYGRPPKEPVQCLGLETVHVHMKAQLMIVLIESAYRKHCPKQPGDAFPVRLVIIHVLDPCLEESRRRIL